MNRNLLIAAAALVLVGGFALATRGYRANTVETVNTIAKEQWTTLVPSHAQRLFEAVGHTDKEYADVAGADHYYIERPELLPRAVELCSDWIARKFG